MGLENTLVVMTSAAIVQEMLLLIQSVFLLCNIILTFISLELIFT